MRSVAASLAAVVLALAAAGCGGDGAEPGAPEGATLVLDFQPNAVHAGIYAAQREGLFEDEGVDLDDPRALLDERRREAARGRPRRLRGHGHQRLRDRPRARRRPGRDRRDRPAAARLGDRPRPRRHRTPADLAGKTVGVTGVPSDDAVLDTVLRSGGVDPGDVDRITIGFNAVSALAAGRIDAATAFWNAEGVELNRLGIPTREFRVDDFGAPRYPELVLVGRSGEDELADPIVAALTRGYEILGTDPDGALEDLLAEVSGLDRSSQTAQMAALTSGRAFATRGSAATPELDNSISGWRRWAERSGLLAGQ